MISCSKCAKENQDHYKFCLGCGAELARGAAPKAFSPQTPPHGMAAVQPPAAPSPVIAHTPAAAPVAPAAPRPSGVPRPTPSAAPPQASAPPAAVAVAPTPAPAPAPAAATTSCPQCQAPNGPTNRFCASCGFNLAPAPAPAPQPASSPAPSGAAITLTALRPDGTDLGSFTLPGQSATIGRDLGGIFAGDSYLSPRHATISARQGKLFVKDEDSLNGVYRKLAPHSPVELRDGSIFRIGQEIIRFETLKRQPAGPDGVEKLGSPADGYIGRISLLIGRETTGNSFPVPEQGVHIGRERGDVLFPEDGYVSGLHCQVVVDGGKVWLIDVGSSNGSFIRIDGEHEIEPGEILLMGQQLYRVTI